jgi:hypothetical protein
MGDAYQYRLGSLRDLIAVYDTEINQQAHCGSDCEIPFPIRSLRPCCDHG